MRIHDSNSDAGEPSHRQQGYASRIRAVSSNGKTVLFDAASTDRWIQSDTTVDLGEIA